ATLAVGLVASCSGSIGGNGANPGGAGMSGSGTGTSGTAGTGTGTGTAGTNGTGTAGTTGSGTGTAGTTGTGTAGTTGTGGIPTGTGGTGTPTPPFEPVAAAVAVRKVKNLLTGLAPTDADVTTATTNGVAGLKSLIDTWMNDSQYQP